MTRYSGILVLPITNSNVMFPNNGNSRVFKLRLNIKTINFRRFCR